MLEELVRRTRSYRRFEEREKLTESMLWELVEHARLAPCAANLQLLRFSIVAEETACSRLFPLLKWAGYLEDWDGPAEGERPAAYIVISGPAEEASYTRIDVGIAAAYLVLAAMEQGVGSCMLLSFDHAETGKLLPLPDGHAPKLVIALGKPSEKVVLEDVGPEGNIRYWRDSDGVHHVPKRSLEELILS